MIKEMSGKSMSKECGDIVLFSKDFFENATIRLQQTFLDICLPLLLKNIKRLSSLIAN